MLRGRGEYGWMRVTGVFIKPARGEPMREVERGEATAHGLVGDCHAHPLGPRQVLVVRQEDLEDLGLAVWQVRANVAIVGASEETLRSGTVLRIGASAEVRVTHECEVCRVLRRYVPGELFGALPGRRGWLGVFVRPGEIAVGDPVRADVARYPAVPDRIYDRLAWVLARVPRGRVVTYDALLTLVGASRPYFRVLPTYLRRAHQAGLPVHRVLTSAGEPTGVVAQQLEALAAEGVHDLPEHRWDARRLYIETIETDSRPSSTLH